MKTLQWRPTTHQQREIGIRVLQKTKFMVLLLLSVFIFTSCSDDDGDDCIDEIHSENVTSVDAPETAQVD